MSTTSSQTVQKKKKKVIYTERKRDKINVAKWQHLENLGEEY